MRMFTVTDSSNVRAIGYDAATRELRITFGSPSAVGTTYTYPAVPPDLVGHLIGAPSIGEFVARGIRPRFTGNKLDETQQLAAEKAG